MGAIYKHLVSILECVLDENQDEYKGRKKRDFCAWVAPIFRDLEEEKAFTKETEKGNNENGGKLGESRISGAT